jgi:hypothetical protein
MTKKQMVELCTYKQILVNAKLRIGKRSKKREVWEKSMKEAKVHMDCSAIEEEEEEVRLFNFTNCCHVISCHYKRHGVEARNSS